MKFINAAVLATCALLVGSADAAAQIQGRPAPPRNGVCFYDDVNYGGDYFCTDTNTQNGLLEMNDRISSIRVFGNAEVTVWVDRNYQGRSQTFTEDVSDLRPGGINDAITSFRVGVAQGGRQVGSRFGRPATPANGACFYENINYQGQYFCSSLGESVEMVPQGTNDRISSVRLFGNAELMVYRDRDFAGPSQLLNASEPDLREFGWDDAISSYRIERRGAFGYRDRGYGNNGNGRGYGYGRANRDRDYEYNEPTTGSMEWRGLVDGRVQLVIRGRSVEERTVSGARTAQGRASFSSGLPAEPVRVTVRSLMGRGDVWVAQQPSRQNGFTAIIEISDPAWGSQEHRLQISWR